MRLVRIPTRVDAATLAGCLADIPATERTHYPLDRPAQRRRVVAHAVLRRLLGKHLGIHPRAVRLHRPHWGKPVLLEPAAVHFSLSYSGDQALLALAPTPVGVDIESTLPDDLAQVARHVYTPEEQARVCTCVAPARTFLTIWTAKEAVLKLWGTGFQLDPRSVCVPPVRAEFQPVHIVHAAPHTSACMVAHWQIEPGVAVAAALHAPPASMTWEHYAHD